MTQNTGEVHQLTYLSKLWVSKLCFMAFACSSRFRQGRANSHLGTGELHELAQDPDIRSPVRFSRGNLYREGQGTACRPRQLSPPDFVSGGHRHYVERAVKAHRSNQVDALLYFEQTVEISTVGDVVEADLIPVCQRFRRVSERPVAAQPVKQKVQKTDCASPRNFRGKVVAGPRSRPSGTRYSGDTTPKTNHPVSTSDGGCFRRFSVLNEARRACKDRATVADHPKDAKDGRNPPSPVHTGCNAEERSMNTEPTSHVYCCEFCVPGTTATGQFSWTSYAICCGVGTLCVCSEPPPTSKWGWSHPIWHMWWTLAEKTLDTLDDAAAFEVLISMSRELKNLSEAFHSLRHCRRLRSGVSTPRTNHPDDTEDGGGSAEPVS